MRELAGRNTTWMQIVETPAQARTVMNAGKLAVVLSVELDTLTVAQITQLRVLGVRHVIPVHFADNTFGGPALYATSATGPEDENIFIGMGTAARAGERALEDWVCDFSAVARALDGHGVALGTDINGLQPQLVSTGRTSRYPITTASSRAPLSLSATAPPLPAYRLGRRTFEGRRDGLAHYGMLAELLQALETVPAQAERGCLSGSSVVDALFQSAEAVVAYWETVERASAIAF